MEPIEVIIIGIGVVFVTLGILTLGTYLLGWIINRFFVKDEDENARVAAIVAALYSRGVG